MTPRFNKIPSLIITVLFIVIGIFAVPKAKKPAAMAALLAGALILVLASEYQRFRRSQAQPGQGIKSAKRTARVRQPSRLGEKGLKWFCWDAHVDILLPESLATAWEGTEPPTDGRVIDAKFRSEPGKPACDYDRACDIEAAIAPIPVGSGTGLVISNAPLITWVSQPGGGCLVVALAWGELSDDLALQAAAATPPEDFGAPSFTFDSPDSRLVLFAAADTYGSQYGYGHLAIDLSAGSYRVNTAEWKQDATLLLHSFQRI